MIAGPFAGGCLCKSIRYEIDRVFDVIYCHCSQCRRSSGAPVSLAAAVARDAFRLTAGRPSVYQTSASGRSYFCAACGSGLYGEFVAPGHPLARDGRYYSVRVGTLDDPERLRPQIHQFIDNKLLWFDTTDDLPRVAGNTLPHPDKREPPHENAKILLLTGPPAAGKNTIAHLLSAKRKRCAVVDCDIVRWMILQPHRAPWDGDEGRAQHLLGIRNASTLAKRFVGSGFDTIVLDVVTDDKIRAYRTELNPFRFTTVQLLPTFDEIIRRGGTRSHFLTDEEIEMLYKEQTHLEIFDRKIDTTALSAEQVAELLDQMLN